MNEREISQRMQDAQLAEQRGQLDIAAQHYQQVHTARPNFSPALFCMGLLCMRRGDAINASTFLVRAISIAPNEPIYRLNITTILLSLGETDAALLHARKARLLVPDSAEAAQNLGACHFAAGRFEEAAEAARATVVLAPNSSTAHFNLGMTYLKCSQIAEACESFEQVVRIDLNHFDARIELAKHYLQLSRSSDAMKHCVKAIELRPSHAVAHMLQGIALHKQNLFEPAASALKLAVEFGPQSWAAYFFLGQTLTALERWPEAAQAYETAYTLQPTDVDNLEGLLYALRILRAWDRISQVIEEAITRSATAVTAMAAKAEILCDQGQFVTAAQLAKDALSMNPGSLKATLAYAAALAGQADFDTAIKVLDQQSKNHPRSPGIKYNRGVLKLTVGDITGWADYEYRHEIPGVTRRGLLGLDKISKWNGSSLTGKTLFLYQEQGIGDFLQCIRALPELAARAKRVVVFTLPEVALMMVKLSNVDVVTDPAQIPPVDFCVGDMSLPLLLGWSPVEPPTKESYLAEPDARTLSHWRDELKHLSGFRIGIAWTGSITQLQNHRRLIPLQALAPMARIEGVNLVSLQMGPKAAEIHSVDFPIFDLSQNITTLADTAAIIRQLDLVITVDTSVAHLAGAMNAPVWTMLSKVCDFRWLLDRDTSPWYPSMRLFRQKESGQWESVVNDIVQALSVVIAK